MLATAVVGLLVFALIIMVALVISLIKGDRKDREARERRWI